MIVDASALLAIILGEDEKAEFEEVLAVMDGDLSISPVNYVEAFVRLSRLDRQDCIIALDHLIEAAGIRIEPVTEAHAHLARQAHVTYGKGNHPARLNLGDCFTYALSKAERLPLLFKGDDFRQTDIKAAL
jgi:ribonuclease VapC